MKKIDKTRPLAFLLCLALSAISISHAYAGKLSDQLELIEARLETMGHLHDKLERLKLDKANEELLREYMERLAHVNVAGAAELFHEDMVLEMPNSPSVIAAHSPRKIVGKPAVVQYYNNGLGSEADGTIQVYLHSIEHLKEPGALVYKYHEIGKIKNGPSFVLDILSFIRFEDGKIIHLEEWTDGEQMTKAFGGMQ